MLDHKKFLVDNIDINKGTITELEDKILNDDNGAYVTELKQFVEKKIKTLHENDYKEKDKAIKALNSFLLAVTSYRAFVEERKN